MLFASATFLSPEIGQYFRKTCERFDFNGTARTLKSPSLKMGEIVVPDPLKNFLKKTLDPTTLCC
jgi:hypothetical protein